MSRPPSGWVQMKVHSLFMFLGLSVWSLLSQLRSWTPSLFPVPVKRGQGIPSHNCGIDTDLPSVTPEQTQAMDRWFCPDII